MQHLLFENSNENDVATSKASPTTDQHFHPSIFKETGQIDEPNWVGVFQFHVLFFAHFGIVMCSHWTFDYDSLVSQFNSFLRSYFIIRLAHHIGLAYLYHQNWEWANGRMAQAIQTIWMISKNWIDLTKSTWAANFNAGFLVIRQHNRRTDATTTKLKLMELSQPNGKKCSETEMNWNITDTQTKKFTSKSHCQLLFIRCPLHCQFLRK